MPQDKGKEGLDKKRMVSLTNNLPIADLESVMQWEGTKTEAEASKLIERDIKMGGEMGLELKENISWAENNTSPLAISFDQNKGGTAETLGPNSGH